MQPPRAPPSLAAKAVAGCPPPPATAAAAASLWTSGGRNTARRLRKPDGGGAAYEELLGVSSAPARVEVFREGLPTPTLSLAFDSPPLGAAWADLGSDGSSWLCALASHSVLWALAPDGLQHEAALPCAAAALHALSAPLGPAFGPAAGTETGAALPGLLIERGRTPDELRRRGRRAAAGPPASPPRSAGAGAAPNLSPMAMSDDGSDGRLDDEVPSLFSLRHPLEEPKPIGVESAEGGAAPLTLLTDPAEFAVLACSRPRVLLTFNVRTRRHTLWALTPVTPTATPPPDAAVGTPFRSPAAGGGGGGGNALSDALSASLGLSGGSAAAAPLSDALSASLGLRGSLPAAPQSPPAADDDQTAAARTLSTLGEDDDAAVEPDIVLRALWSGAVGVDGDDGDGDDDDDDGGDDGDAAAAAAAAAASAAPHFAPPPAFVATDGDGAPLVCMLRGGQLCTVRLTMADDGVSVAAAAEGYREAPVRSAAPVAAAWDLPHHSGTPPPVDVLVLRPDGSLGLHRGRTLVSAVHVVGTDGAPSRRTPLRLSDAVGDRVTVSLSDDFSDGADEEALHLRVVLPLGVASPLAAAAIGCLDAALPPALALPCRAALLECDQLSGGPGPAADAAAAASPDPMWHVCARLLYRLLVGEPENGHDATDAAAAMDDPPPPADPWQALLASDYHAAFADAGGARCLPPPPPAATTAAAANPFAAAPVGLPALPELDGPSRRRALEALHLLYEDRTLSVDHWGQLLPLGRLLHAVARAHGLRRFADHYARGLGLAGTGEGAAATQTAADESSVPCVSSWLLAACSAAPPAAGFPALPPAPHASTSPCEATRAVCRLYSVLRGAGDSAAAAARLVDVMVEERFDSERLALLPAGVALPLRDALRRCRDDPPGHWPAAAYLLVGRPDLAMLCGGADAPPAAAAASAAPGGLPPGAAAADEDGLGMLEPLTALRFGTDRRVREAARLLRVSRAVFMRLERSVEVSDHDFEAKKQAKLLLLCTRSMATCVGRGMLTLGTFTQALAEPLKIPPLVLSGRMPPTNVTVALETTALHADLTLWPEFHNGCAAGLRLKPKTAGHAIDRTWIVYNRPPAPSAAHGGLLLALGLSGHLDCLAMTDVYEYLALGHTPTTVGVLLGMAAARAGSADGQTSKMLCLHVPALLPPPFAEMEVAAPVQAAAIAGVGLLYQGTGHRLMVEFLLGEMGKRPTSDRVSDREGYVLACGLSLGMVTLGLGRAPHGGAAGLADLRIEQRLHRFVIGGRDPAAARHDHAGAAAADGGGGGAGAPDEGAAAGNLVGSSGAPPPAHHGDAPRCSRIFEGEYINTAVTAPGACLALGLMFLKSENSAVAARLVLPDTHFHLDDVRPDVLGVRVIARSLILWATVRPTTAWVEAQLPRIVHDAYARVCAKNGPPAAGTASARANEPTSERVDWDSVKQARANVVAGACFALGLRFAGSGSEAARDTISAELRHFAALRKAPDGAYGRPDRHTLETCIAMAALGLAMVMAGSGDLDALRVLRELRWSTEAEVKYGHHMALHMAVGLLFVGGGFSGIGNDDKAVAALLAAFAPHFPNATHDHRYHLQPLRHLYVLATRPSALTALDADTLEPVPVPLQVLAASPGARPIDLVAPCLLPEAAGVAQILVRSARYYPLNLRTGPGERHRGVLSTLTLYVKRRAGHQSYARDPRGRLSVLARPFQSSADHEVSKAEFVAMFTQDPALVALARFLDDGGSRGGDPASGSGSGSGSGSDSDGEMDESPVGGDGRGGGGAAATAAAPREEGDGGLWGSCGESLFECLAHDKAEMIPAHVALRHMLQLLGGRGRGGARGCAAWNLRMVLAYYRGGRDAGPDAPPPLLSRELVEELHVRRAALCRATADATLKAYVADGAFPDDPAAARDLGTCLLAYGVPDPADLRAARGVGEEARHARLAGLGVDGACLVRLGW